VTDEEDDAQAQDFVETRLTDQVSAPPCTALWQCQHRADGLHLDSTCACAPASICNAVFSFMLLTCLSSGWCRSTTSRCAQPLLFVLAFCGTTSVLLTAVEGSNNVLCFIRCVSSETQLYMYLLADCR
jgi:hypothetical protein